MNLNKLITDGKQVLPFNFNSTDQKQLIQGLKQIIDLPADKRALWLHKVPGDTTSEPDNGLSERGVKDQKDPKFFFHYRHCLVDQLIQAGVNLEPHQKFLQGARILCSDLVKLAEDVLMSLDEELPGYDFLARLMQRPEQLRYTLRFLYYKPGYEKMAELHDDRGGLTFAVAESRPGLYFENDNQLYLPDENQILAFNGLKAELHTSGALKSMRHYVKNLVFNEPRWAIVFFIHYHIDVMNDVQVEHLTAQRKGSAISTY